MNNSRLNDFLHNCLITMLIILIIIGVIARGLVVLGLLN